MTHGSLFAGVGGFDLGFERAGFETLWQVEKEPFCIAVLKTRFPDVERYYEIKDCGHGRKHKLRPVDVVTAGFPCQDLSVAGKRAGLAGARSGLFWELARILGELQPAWIVIENVPGLLSSDEGRDFAIVLRELGGIGYGLAWRVLDSQFFGVAQRRRRVFIVGSFGRPCPAEVLFETEDDGSRSSGFDGTLVIQRRGGFGWSAYSGLSPTLQAEQFPHTGGPDRVPFVIRTAQTSANGHGVACDIAHTLDGANGQALLRPETDADRVRDASGLPEGLDSARYRSLGNAVTVSVANWIAKRILEAERQMNPQRPGELREAVKAE